MMTPRSMGRFAPPSPSKSDVLFSFTLLTLRLAVTSGAFFAVCIDPNINQEERHPKIAGVIVAQASGDKK